MKLPENHATVLAALDGIDSKDIDAIADETGLAPETVAGAAFALEESGYVEVQSSDVVDVSVTGEGIEYVDDGLPEERLHDAVITIGGVAVPVPIGEAIAAAGLEGNRVEIALSNYARKGYGTIADGEITADEANVEDAEPAALQTIVESGTHESIAADVLDSLEHRNLLSRTDRTIRSVALTEAGQNLLEAGVSITDAVGRLTPEMLTTGEWRDVSFSSYDVTADSPIDYGGSEHALRRMAERVKDVLVGMGFQEMDGPHIDADFWINDCLFMPQDHPARTHWDRFELEDPTAIDGLPEELVEAVKAVHKNGVGPDGEGYHSPWEESIAKELALRGHTTSLSARHLAGVAKGDLEPPQRFFSVEKAYRNDTIDATHLLEFFQIEGWVMADALSVRDLMGTFTEFYEHFGITGLEFKPHYNPYTEPSFELFGTHPRTGELIEIGNSGIFRPEMLEPLGVEADVMAWGLALERLMMLVTGAEDIRDVHGTLVDLDFLRTERVVY